ncbi:DUF2195 family protein [Hahella sp. HN01]|uniref:DUF2195 family protein n=1 Tax=Hahella sp. HN01 TaxID=2847262 RepID=UPI001C1EC455|nr:DUF2195 family protein [Hahella sp. HN01]MBU6954658.1 DUF2195 family protein [Hahella sp. HN01]
MSKYIRILFLFTSIGNVGACQANGHRADLSIERFQFSNKLEACLELKPAKVQEDDDRITLLADVALHDSIASCTCMSALINYQVVDEFEVDGVKIENELLRAFKNTALIQEKHLSFIISTEPDYEFKGHVSVRVSCRPAL